jgi:hypothetical protein
VIVLFGQFLVNYRSSRPNFWDTYFFHFLGYALNFWRQWIGIHFGRFFSLTNLVILLSSHQKPPRVSPATLWRPLSSNFPSLPSTLICTRTLRQKEREWDGRLLKPMILHPYLILSTVLHSMYADLGPMLWWLFSAICAKLRRKKYVFFLKTNVMIQVRIILLCLESKNPNYSPTFWAKISLKS